MRLLALLVLVGVGSSVVTAVLQPESDPCAESKPTVDWDALERRAAEQQRQRDHRAACVLEFTTADNPSARQLRDCLDAASGRTNGG